MFLILKKYFLVDLSLRNVLLILCSLFFSNEVYSAPATVTFQARIVKPDLTNLESSNVSFKFYYLYPKPVGTDLQCVIYAEEINGVNMTGSKGLVTLQLGSGTRTYGSGNLKNVFDNSTVSYACQAGGTYTPAATDNRRIIVQFNDGTGVQTLPPSDLSAVPYAMQSYNSQRLGNSLATDFLKFTDFTGTCGAGEYLKYDSTASPKFSCAIPTGTGAGIVMSVAPGTGPLLVGGTAADPTISIPQASASTDGYLSSADFTTFSSKLSNLSSLTSGDITGKLGFTPAANNDSRFTDTRTPTDGSVTAAKIASATITFDKFNQSAAAIGQVIKWNGSAWIASTDNTSAGGAVTSVAGRTGVVTLSSGDISGLAFGTTSGTFAQGNDSRFTDTRTPTDNSVTSAKILDGTIAAADLSSMDATAGQVMKWNGSAWVASSDVSSGGSVTTVTASGPLLSSGGSAPNITLAKATAGVDGYLSSADFTIFAAKLSDFSSLLSSDITGKLGYTPVNPATAVTSVAGRTGVVTLSSSDITGLGSLAGKSTIVSDDISASAITFDKLNQSSAATGQVIKWNGSAWSASADNSLSASGGSGYLQFSNGSNSLSSDSSLFWNNAAQQLKIGFNFPSTAQLAVQQRDSDALIDIRSDNGEAKLKVYGGEGLSNGIDFYTYGNGTPHAFIDGRSGISPGSAGLLIGTKTDRSLNFQTNNSTRLVISSTGQVGVGVTNPTSYALQVSGDVSISGKFKMNGIDISTGSGTVTSVTSGGSPIVVAGTSADPTIAITRATASVDGYLSSSDFTTFAAKLSNFSTLLSSDITGKLGYTPANEASSWSLNSSGDVSRITGNVGIGTISPSVSLDLGLRTDALRFPAGTTGERPSSPQSGMIRMNTTTTQLEYYDGTTWSALGADGVPVGTIASFNAVCPSGWSEYTDAQGRVIIGAGTGPGLTNRVLGTTGGSELTDISGLNVIGSVQIKIGTTTTTGRGLVPVAGSMLTAVAAAQGAHYVAPGGGATNDLQIGPDLPITAALGGGGGNSGNMQPFIALRTCIKTTGGASDASKVTALNNLTDVDIASLGNGSVLTYNGSKWVASSPMWVVNGSNINYVTGNVGIGVANPSHALQVSGDVSISGKFKVNGIDISTGSGTVTSVTSGGSPIVVAGTSADPTIAITRATASVDGYLSSSDFTTFAAKLSNFSTLLSSDITGKLGYTPAANNDSRFTDERTPVNGSVTAAKLESGSNGQLFIGNGAGFTKATLTGTTDQVNVTNGSGTITLSTPQSIATSSSPSFTGLTVSGITGNTLLRANGSGVLANATSADITGLLGFTPANSTSSWSSNASGDVSRVTGKVGIGTASPTVALDVNGAVKSTAFQLSTGAGVNKVLTSDASGNATWAPVGQRLWSIVSKTADYTVTSLDGGSYFIFTASVNATLSLPAASSAGAGFTFGVRNNNTNNSKITLDPNGAETIEGQASMDLGFGSGVTFFCDGTQWFRIESGITSVTTTTFANAVEFLVASSGINWTAPIGVTLVRIHVWGAGGGGGGGAISNNTSYLGGSGADGESSSFGGLVSAAGGKAGGGGAYNTTALGGNGAAGSGGIMNVVGGKGGNAAGSGGGGGGSSGGDSPYTSNGGDSSNYNGGNGAANSALLPSGGVSGGTSGGASGTDETGVSQLESGPGGAGGDGYFSGSGGTGGAGGGAGGFASGTFSVIPGNTFSITVGRGGGGGQGARWYSASGANGNAATGVLGGGGTAYNKGGTVGSTSNGAPGGGSNSGGGAGNTGAAGVDGGAGGNGSGYGAPGGGGGAIPGGGGGGGGATNVNGTTSAYGGGGGGGGDGRIILEW